jgi:RNA polymerase sigma-70 factor (ECF subfamily)
MSNSVKDAAIRDQDHSSQSQRQDEELLLEYATTRSQGVFAELVHRYEREMYRYLRRYLGDATMAEDVFQATFLQVHLKWRQFEAGRKVKPWLYTIATNQARDLLRRNRRHRVVSLNSAAHDGSQVESGGSLQDQLQGKDRNPRDELEVTERRHSVRCAVEQLPAQLKVVVLQVLYQGLKYREAADALKIPLGTVKSRLHLAMKLLQKLISPTLVSADRHNCVSWIKA